jgi:D-3-phosphoglycerate dehydrogenase / 2-oxoglutarate reductase
VSSRPSDSASQQGRPRTVVITDHPWPDVEIERSILAAAGLELRAGPGRAGTAAEIEALVAKHDPVAIMTCWAEVSSRAVSLPTDLRVVSRMGVGLDNIAVDTATARGAWVVNVPDYCVEEVSDHAVALLLAHWRSLVVLDRASKQGVWNPTSAATRRVSRMTIGILGYGRIGSATARKLSRGFGCRVLVNSPTLLRTPGPGRDASPGIQVAELAQIQREADAIVLHLPLAESTRYLVNATFLAACRRKPFLVNVSRGGLVDNAALLAALDQGLLSGAALDVVEGEPAPPAIVIGRADVIATPHIGFLSDASVAEVRERSSEDVVRVLRGELPRHPCNAPLRA